MSGPGKHIQDYWIDESRWDPASQYGNLNIAGWHVTEEGITYLVAHDGPESLEPAPWSSFSHWRMLSISDAMSPRGFLAFLIRSRRQDFKPTGLHRHEISSDRHGSDRAKKLRATCGNGLVLIEGKEFRTQYLRIRKAAKKVKALAKNPLVGAREDAARGFLQEALRRAVNNNVPEERVIDLFEEEIRTWKVKDVLES